MDLFSPGPNGETRKIERQLALLRWIEQRADKDGRVLRSALREHYNATYSDGSVGVRRAGPTSSFDPGQYGTRRRGAEPMTRDLRNFRYDSRHTGSQGTRATEDLKTDIKYLEKAGILKREGDTFVTVTDWTRLRDALRTT